MFNGSHWHALQNSFISLFLFQLGFWDELALTILLTLCCKNHVWEV